MQPLPPAGWLSAAVSAGYLPCLERFVRIAASDTCRYPLSEADRGPLVLALLEGRSLAALVSCGEERHAAALLVTAIKATASVSLGFRDTPADSLERAAASRFATIPGALAELTLEVLQRTRAGSRGGNGDAGGQIIASSPGASGESSSGGSGGDTPCHTQGSAGVPAPEAGAVQQGGSGAAAATGRQPGAQTAQQQQLNKLLRLLSLCVARWLPLSAMMLWTPEGEEEHPARRPMLRLAGLAREAAEGRGNARGTESWAQLLGMSGKASGFVVPALDIDDAPGQQQGMAGGGGTAGGAGGEVEERGCGWEQLAALLLPPCDVAREVLLVCRNPACVSLGGVSEARVQLFECKRVCESLGHADPEPYRCMGCLGGSTNGALWMIPLPGGGFEWKVCVK